MPNKGIHTLWKLYIDTMRDKAKAEAAASEEVMDEVVDEMEG